MYSIKDEWLSEIKCKFSTCKDFISIYAVYTYFTSSVLYAHDAEIINKTSANIDPCVFHQ